jgi:hypothetical protein
VRVRVHRRREQPLARFHNRGSLHHSRTRVMIVPESRAYSLAASEGSSFASGRSVTSVRTYVGPADEQALQKYHIPRQWLSLHVEARILLTTVAGRSSMDRMAEGIKHMVIETVLFVAFVVIVGAAIVKAYEWRHDVLYGPYIKAGD